MSADDSETRDGPGNRLAETEQHLRALLDIITRQGGFMRDEDLIAVQHARHHLEKKP
jgi:hypothetical protein